MEQTGKMKMRTLFRVKVGILPTKKSGPRVDMILGEGKDGKIWPDMVDLLGGLVGDCVRGMEEW